MRSSPLSRLAGATMEFAVGMDLAARLRATDRGSWRVGLVAAMAALAAVSCGRDSGQTAALERFAARSEVLLAKTESLALRAETFDQEEALAGLSPNARNGFHFRLDRVAPTSIEGGPSPGALSPGGPNRGSEKPGVVALRPLRSAVRRSGTTQIIEYQKGDRLENSEPIRLEKTAIAEFELRIKLEHSKTIELGWSSRLAGESGAAERNGRRKKTRVYIDTVPDGSFHTYRVNAVNALQIGKEPEDIRHIFLQASRTTHDQIELDYLRIVAKGERYARSDWGQSYEEFDGQMRGVLYTATPRSLRYPLTLPAGAVFLKTGMAALNADDPIDFSVRVHDATGVRTVLQQRIETPDQWHDEKVDLTAFSGKPVEIELRASSQNGNLAFWSNPVLFGPPRERFNVLFIVQDALRADRLSAYGHTRETSPSFDAFVRRGILFEHAFSQATMTRPSAAAMMTGLYPTAVGVWNFHEMLDDRYITLAEILRSQGFATAAFMGNPNAGPYAGLHQGFEFLVHRFPGRARLPGERYLIQRASEILGPDVERWVDHNMDRNFFLYLHIVDPHAAYDAPPPFDRWFQEADTAALPKLEPNPRVDPPSIARPTGEGRRRMYDGEILYNDHHIARLLEHFDSLGILQHTLVIFASDHGEFLGVRDPDEWDHHPPGYTQVTRVPLAMILPDALPANRRISQAVQLIDVLPTILDLAGIDDSGLILQGQSLVPLATSSETDSRSDRVVISDEVIGRPRGDARPWGSVYFDGVHFLNSRKFYDRLALAQSDLDVSTQIEVFRYAEDASEARNLADDPAWWPWKSETSSFLQKLIEKNGRISKAMAGDSNDEIRLDPDVREQLKGLGYLP